MKYIESEMAKQGKLPPEWDKGIGARIMMYASAIIWEKIAISNTLIDGQTVRKLARPLDKKISILLYSSLVIMVALTFLCNFIIEY